MWRHFPRFVKEEFLASVSSRQPSLPSAFAAAAALLYFGHTHAGPYEHRGMTA
jgi:hypothetical protein